MIFMGGDSRIDGNFVDNFKAPVLKKNEKYHVKLVINFKIGNIQLFIKGVNKGFLVTNNTNLKYGKYVFTINAYANATVELISSKIGNDKIPDPKETAKKLKDLHQKFNDCDDENFELK